MAVIVEDGSIVTNANSYVSEAELSAYATARGLTLTASAEQLITKSMDFIETRSFAGIKYTQDQELQFPRSSLYIDSYLVSTSTIPKQLKNAQMETAIAIDQGFDPLAVVDRPKNKVKVGPISVEYDDKEFEPIVKKINAYLSPLLAAGSNQFRIIRG